MARTDTLKNFLTDIADKFREKLGIEGVINHSDYDTKIDDVYDKGVSDGKEDEKNDFVNNYIDSKNGEFSYAFYRWTDDFYKPTKNIVASVVDSMYSYSTITDTLVDITLTGTSCGSAFYMANRLVKIKNLILNNDTEFVSTVFRNCGALIDLTISGNGKIITSITLQYSKQLDGKSIESVVKALSPTVTGQAITLSKQAVNNAFGINVDDASTFPEGSEYYKLRYSKANWTFNYV